MWTMEYVTVSGTSGVKYADFRRPAIPSSSLLLTPPSSLKHAVRYHKPIVGKECASMNDD